jgi:WD40 repeat protein
MLNIQVYKDIIDNIENNNLIFLKDYENDKNSFCAKCSKFLIEPFFANCGHYYCSNCLDQSKNKYKNKCLLNFSEIEEIYFDKKKQYENLSKLIKCPFNPKKCKWRNPIKEIISHSDICKYKIIKCEKNCGEFLMRSKMEFHLINECKERIINCKYCNEEFHLNKITKHLDKECQNIPIICPNNCNINFNLTIGEDDKNYLCPLIITRKNLENHLKICKLEKIECLVCGEKIQRDKIKDHLYENILEHFATLKINMDSMKNSYEKKIKILKKEINTIKKDDLFNLKFNKLIKFETKANVNKIIQLNTFKIATSGNEKNVKIWELEKGKLIKELIGHEDNINDLLNLNNEILISCSKDTTLRLWNLKDDEYNCIKIINLNNEVSSILKLTKEFYVINIFSLNLQIWGFDNNNNNYNNNFKFLRILRDDKYTISSIKRLSNEKLATISDFDGLKIWNFITGEMLFYLYKSYCIYNLIEFDDNFLVISCTENNINFVKKINFYTGECILNLIIKQKFSFNFKSNLMKINENIISFTQNNYQGIILINLNTGKYENEIFAHFLNNEIYGVELIKKIDENFIVSYGNDKKIKFWNVKYCEKIKTIKTKNLNLKDLILLQNSCMIGITENQLYLWTDFE